MATPEYLTEKSPNETITVTFDFTPAIDSGETISTVNSITVTTYLGTDASPSAILNGAASISSLKVLQSVFAGTAGVDYKLICKITTSASRVLELGGILPVRNIN